MFRYHTATDGRPYGMAAGILARLGDPRERGVVAQGACGVAVARETLPELLDALGISRSVMFVGGAECVGTVALSDDEWAAAAFGLERIREGKRMEDMPDKWVPSALRPAERPKAEPEFAVGVRTAPNEYGMTHGPFRELENALEVVPDDTIELPVFVLRLDIANDKRECLYRWAGDSWVRVARRD